MKRWFVFTSLLLAHMVCAMVTAGAVCQYLWIDGGWTFSISCGAALLMGVLDVFAFDFLGVFDY